MDGQKKQFIGICILVVLCLTAYLGLKIYNEKSANKEQEKADSNKIEAVNIDSEKVKSFSYQTEAATLTFEKEKDTWYYQPDHSIKIDQEKIRDMLETVKSITAEEKLENIKNTKEYGFDHPLNILTFVMEDGTRTVTVGMKNDITSQYYIMDNNSDAIYIVNKDLSTPFSKSLEDMKAAEKEDTKQNK